MLSTVGFIKSQLGLGFRLYISGERAWVIVWYGNDTVALGTLHFQAPVCSSNCCYLMTSCKYASSGRGGAACCSQPQLAGQLGLERLKHTVWSCGPETSVKLLSGCRMLYFQAPVTHEVVWDCCCAPSDISTIFGTGCIIECLIPETRGQYKGWVHCHVSVSFIVSRSRRYCGR